MARRIPRRTGGDYLDQLELDDLLGRLPPSGKNVDDELYAAAAKEFQDETNADEDSDEIDPDNPPGVASRISLMLANAPWKQITASAVCALLITGIAFFYLTRWVDYSADAASRTMKLQDGSTALLLPHSHVRMRIRLGERQFVQVTRVRRHWMFSTTARSRSLSTRRKHALRRWWSTGVFLGQDPGEPWASVDWRADGDWDWHSAKDDTPEQLWALYDAEVAAADRVYAAARLDALAARTNHHAAAGRPNLRWILGAPDRGVRPATTATPTCSASPSTARSTGRPAE